MGGVGSIDLDIYVSNYSAISTVLNHPHKRHAPPKAHSSLPSVPPADLPRVRRKDFDSYLKAITPEWEKYQQNSQLGKEGQAQIDAARFAIPEEDEEGEGRYDIEMEDAPGGGTSVPNGSDAMDEDRPDPGTK